MTTYHQISGERPNRRPAIYLFLFALIGALGGYAIAIPHLWLISSALALMVALIFRSDIIRIACLLFLTCFAVAWSMADSTLNFGLTLAALPGEEVIFLGVIKDFSKKEDSSTTALVTCREAAIDDGPVFNLVLRLREGASNIALKNGYRILFKGRAFAYKRPDSAALFDGFRFGLSRGMHGRMTIRDANAVWLGERVERFYFADLRRYLTEQLMTITSPHEASLLLALMIGDTNLLSEEQTRIYRGIGAQHLLAVSGLQVTLIAWLFFWLLMPLWGFILPRTLSHHAHALSAMVTVAATFFFIGLSGFTASATRAFLMALIMLLPTIWARKIDLFDAFFVSAFLTILAQPTVVLDLGFLLSYAAVLGLLVAHDRSKGWRYHLIKRSMVLFWSVSLLISSAAAFLATLPILALFFCRISPLSIVANLILVPVAGILQIPAILSGLFGGFLTCAPLIRWAALFANSIEVLAESLSPLLAVEIHGLPLTNIATALLAISLLLLFLIALRPKRSLIFLSMTLAIYPAAELIKSRREFKITVMPIGQGDATLFSLPSGEHVLIDAGGQANSDFDPGQRIALPILWHQGVRSLDVLAITHPDSDHILGAFAILESMPVKEIWHSGFSPDHPLTMRLVSTARQKGIPIKSAVDILGSHRFGDTIVEVLGPAAGNGDSYYQELSANDNSLVLRVVHGDHAFLWPGDIEYVGERLLVERKLNLKAMVLKAPHHGSKTSSSEEFISAVAPAHVIYSTGDGNRFRFPHEEVKKRYEAIGASQWNTADDGELTIVIRNDQIFINGFRRPFKEGAKKIVSEEQP